MKKIINIIIIAAIMLTLASCGNNLDTKSDKKATEPVSVLEDADSADIDLTKLSDTVVYSQLYNMTANPDNFIGKTVRLRGKYGVYDGENRLLLAGTRVHISRFRGISRVQSRPADNN